MNGLYLTLPIFLPLAGGLVSYLIRFPNSRSRHLFYGVLICLTSAVTWLSILRCGSESFQLLRFTEELTLTLGWTALPGSLRGWPLPCGPSPCCTPSTT